MMKLLKKSVLLSLCLMLTFSLIPSVSALGYDDTSGKQEINSSDDKNSNENLQNSEKKTELEQAESNDKKASEKALPVVKSRPKRAIAQSDNIKLGNGIIANFKYEKKIDMRNAKDRKSIPDADFNFTLSTISQADESTYGIGKMFGNADKDAETYKIMAGNLGGGKSQIPFSQVNFRKTDGYDAELTRLIDSKDAGVDTINHILKYDWGEMRSSDHQRTAIARKPTAEEEAEYRKGDTAKSWPKDTILWSGSVEFEDDEENPGSYEAGCALMWDYDFDTFQYVQEFGLQHNLTVSYYAYTYRKPLLTHQEKDSDGNYISVSKGLISPHDYYKMCTKLYESNQLERTEGMEGSQISYRFLLKEDEVGDSKFESNNETKIVDFIPAFYDNVDHTNYTSVMLVFNSVDEADNFYSNYIKHTEQTGFAFDWRLDKNGFAPNANFTNEYVADDKPIQENPNNNPNDNPSNGGHNRINSANPYTGDIGNIALWVISLVVCIGLVGTLLFKRMRR